MSALFLISGRVRDLEIVRLGGGAEECDQDEFSCTVDGLVIEGHFNRVTFLEGEAIDFVVRLEGEKNIFEAARSMVQRKIWMKTLHTAMGHVAFRIAGLKWLIVPPAMLAMFIFVFGQDFPPESFYHEMIDHFGAFYFMLVLLVVMVQLMLTSGARQTTEILSLLGYDHPSRTNLSKINARAARAWKRSNPSIVVRSELWTYRF